MDKFELPEERAAARRPLLVGTSGLLYRLPRVSGSPPWPSFTNPDYHD
jgi:hypothetical protein